MSSSLVNGDEKKVINMSLKQLKSKTREYLKSRKHVQHLVDILKYFENSVENQLAITPCLLAVEQIFTEILKQREMVIDIQPLKPKDVGAETKHREWLQEQYSRAWKLILASFAHPKSHESTQALVTAMRLLCAEGKYPKDSVLRTSTFPVNKMNSILQRLLSSKQSNNHLLIRFKEYGAYLDAVFFTWKLLPNLTLKGKTSSDIYIQNYLDLINAVPISAEVQESKQLLCCEGDQFEFDYPIVRRCLNKAWMCTLLWEFSDQTHKQMLIILLEKVMNHLDKPVLLTDFLMDSLDNGGPISLLALQGIFTLIQQHNLTYPRLYEKLYSMFEPEIFHTKFKARLFYLADIFLSSSHLPENLVAAFVKRLARLSLVAPSQDIIIIIHFIGNLILRHPGLKRLICHLTGGLVSHDPYLMDERDPSQSNALQSSLWEIISLEQHAIPAVAQAAQTISNPLPKVEWDLSNLLEVNEDDIFDQEISRRSKECALSFERPEPVLVTKHDKITQFWKLF